MPSGRPFDEGGREGYISNGILITCGLCGHARLLVPLPHRPSRKYSVAPQEADTEEGVDHDH